MSNKFTPPDQWAAIELEDLELTMNKYSDNEYELIDSDGVGLGVRTYMECLQQLEAYAQEQEELDEGESWGRRITLWRSQRNQSGENNSPLPRAKL